MGILEREEKKKEKGAESLFKEIIDENFLNVQIHKTKRTPNYLNAKIPSPRCIKTVKSQSL